MAFSEVLPSELEKHSRFLRRVVLATLACLIFVVILPDFVFGFLRYNNNTLLVVRHGLTMSVAAVATFYLLVQVRKHRQVILPCLIGTIFLILSQPVRVVRDAHLLDKYLTAYQYDSLALFERLFNAIGLTALVWGFLIGLIELLIARERLEGEHARLLSEMEERRRAEEARIRLATAIEQAAESVIIVDTAGVIEYVNPAFERVTGYPREEAVGQTPRILRSGKHGTEFYAHLWQRISTGDTWQGRFVNKRKDGTLIEEEATISSVRNAAGDICQYVGIERDITNEVSLEHQLRQAQRMEAMGTLAGHVAHDFNNILALVLGHCEIAERTLAEDDPVQFSIRQIVKAGNRARNLVQQILTFSRRIEQERKPVQIHGVVREVLDFLGASLPPTVELRSDIDEDCGWVLADPTNIHQIVMNLCTNAFQSLGGSKGVVELRLDRVALREGFIADVGTPAAGDYVRLMLRDTGCGMSAGTIQHIFDPFFTTKKKGQGTGLGLSAVHGIVSSYGGAITVHSEPGAGSTFEVFLPRLENGAAEKELAGEPIQRGSERILLVDDEVDLADMLRTSLEQLGYTVTAHNSGEKALEIFRADPEKFDLVLTDQVMPDLTGIDLARAILSARPHMPVILLTGFGMGATASRAKAAGVTEYLAKPASTRVLSAAIRRCLEKPPRPGNGVRA